MANSLEFRPALLKQLKRFPKKELVRIRSRIEGVAQNLPDPVTTKMKGNNPFHRVRSGDYRMIYEIRDDRLVILVVNIGHRKDVYQKLLSINNLER